MGAGFYKGSPPVELDNNPDRPETEFLENHQATNQQTEDYDQYIHNNDLNRNEAPVSKRPLEMTFANEKENPIGGPAAQPDRPKGVERDPRGGRAGAAGGRGNSLARAME